MKSVDFKSLPICLPGVCCLKIVIGEISFRIILYVICFVVITSIQFAEKSYVFSADEPACSDWHCELSDNLNPARGCNGSTSTATSSDTSGGVLCIWLNIDVQSPKDTKQLLGVHYCFLQA